jgi:hypothetical protein
MNLSRNIQKPLPGEYPAYASMYIDLLPGDSKLLTHLWNKWSIKEVLVHIVDDERIYAYRALRFARNDRTELPGFDQDPFALYSGADQRPIDSIIEEYEAVRMATIALYESFTDDALLRKGIANKNEATVRALGYHIAGHELHHINIIRKVYLAM